MRDFCPNLNRDKLTYSIKYTFKVQFVIKGCIYTKKGPKKPARIVTKNDITTKHCMFRTKIYASPEHFTHLPHVMDVTFKR